MALVIAGERSGAGKTTITLMVLATLRRWGQSVQSFKVGPDYIDPMFHQAVTQRPCRNLDPVLTSEFYVQDCFARHSQGVESALVEGVMGLFDGATGDNDYASTAHIARLLDLPVVLVIDCGRLSRSVAAIAHGYRTFDPRVRLAGVILNRVGSDRHLDLLKTALEPLGLPILGVLHRHEQITIPDRHLGLVPTEELPGFAAVIEQLAELGTTCFDWERLLPLLTARPETVPARERTGASVRVAIARDRAFNFYYADNLDLLEQLGAELVAWSPLTDQQLPEQIHGLYLGGGFPEVFAAELAANQAARQAVHQAVQAGMPLYAECGGLMYLCRQIVTFEQRAYPMVGVLPPVAQMGRRLKLGYRRAIALQDSPLLAEGETICGHEFHRSDLSLPSQTPLFHLHRYDGTADMGREGWQVHQLHASYLHLHFGAQMHLPARFLARCRNWPNQVKLL